MAKFREIPELAREIKPKNETVFLLEFMCPGCGQKHCISRSWDFNEDFEQPTVNPSIRVRSYKYGKSTMTDGYVIICHSFIKQGYIRYLLDCTHALAGQTIKLPELL